jgi:DNA polymerase-3 subunit beta
MTATAIETGLKVTVTREALRDAVRAVAGAVAKRSTHEVMKHLRFVAENGELRVTASNYDTWVTRVIPAEVRTPGVILLPLDSLSKLVDRLPPEPVQISPAKKGARVMVRCGAVKSEFASMPPDEYPTREFRPAGRAVGRLAPAQIELLAHRTAFCVSVEDTRPIIQGVKVELAKNRLRFIATSGHALASAEAPVEGKGALDVIVLPEVFGHVSRCLGADAEVEVSLGEYDIIFAGPSGEVVARLTEGPYPNVQQVIPRESTRTVVVDREALLAGVRRMVFASGDFQKMKFEFAADGVVLSARDADRGSIEDVVPCRLIGEPVGIAANAHNVAALLDRMPTAEVRIELTSPERAFLIKPEGSTEAGEYFGLIMPIRYVD